MSRTLILLFHRDLSGSHANAALAAAAARLQDVQIVDMQARHGGAAVDLDVQADVALLLGADRLVLQFPIQWYSTPALLKAWQDAVLTRMFYIAEAEGEQLRGTPLMIAATAGNTPQSYRRGGANHFTIDEVLTPLKATAHRCGLPWHPAHLVYAADRLDPAGLEAAARSYVGALEEFMAATPSAAVTEAV